MILFTTFSHEFLNKIQMHLFSKGYKGVSIILCLLSCSKKHQMLQGSSTADDAKPLIKYFWYKICLRQFFLPQTYLSFRMCQLWGRQTGSLYAKFIPRQNLFGLHSDKIFCWLPAFKNREILKKILKILK